MHGGHFSFADTKTQQVDVALNNLQPSPQPLRLSLCVLCANTQCSVPFLFFVSSHSLPKKGFYFWNNLEQYSLLLYYVDPQNVSSIDECLGNINFWLLLIMPKSLYVIINISLYSLQFYLKFSVDPWSFDVVCNVCLCIWDVSSNAEVSIGLCSWLCQTFFSGARL